MACRETDGSPIGRQGKPKMAEIENKKYQEAWHNLQQMQKTLAEGYRLQAALRFHEADLKELSDYKERIEQALSTVQKTRQGNSGRT